VKTIQKLIKGDPRSPAQLKEHYEIEKTLANRLRNSSREERKHLYASLYDELFQQVPYLTRNESPEQKSLNIAAQMHLLRHLLHKDTVFLEIGPGDCALSFLISGNVLKVYGVDVSAEVTRSLSGIPPNFQLILSDGCNIPVTPESIDIAYSHQMVEHLHPDDLSEHLNNVFAALNPGGVYLCVTPNRINGPHDISQILDTTATGFHLKEYTCRELYSHFKAAGFQRVRVYIGGRGRYFLAPVFPVIWLENILDFFPYHFKIRIARNPLLRGFLGIRMIGCN
jgi:SAM-dependent methyltransferase